MSGKKHPKPQGKRPSTMKDPKRDSDETDWRARIIGIGASAGGLETLEIFFSNMPDDTNLAFLIIQHLSPKHKSTMTSILSRFTKMKVQEIEDGMPVLPNHVYLNPPLEKM